MTSLHKSLGKTAIITLSVSPGSDSPLWVGSLMQRKGSGSEWHEAIWRGFTYLVEIKTMVNLMKLKGAIIGQYILSCGFFYYT